MAKGRDILSPSMAKQVGARLINLRGDLSQEAIAEAVGIGRSTLAEIESGKHPAGLATMIALADYFKVPLDWLLGRKPPPGGPLVGQFIEDRDKLALVRFWESLDEADRISATKLLRIPPID